MKLAYPFSQDTRNLFLYEYSCWLCGRSDRGLELHHVLGRVSSSPLNAFCICMECHSHMGHSKEEESKCLQITMRWLLRQGYELTKKDIVFYKTNEKLYNYTNGDRNSKNSM